MHTLSPCLPRTPSAHMRFQSIQGEWDAPLAFVENVPDKGLLAALLLFGSAMEVHKKSHKQGFSFFSLSPSGRGNHGTCVPLFWKITGHTFLPLFFKKRERAFTLYIFDNHRIYVPPLILQKEGTRVQYVFAKITGHAFPPDSSKRGNARSVVKITGHAFLPLLFKKRCF